MTLGKIRIESTGPTSRDKKIFLEGQDITRLVRSVTYRIAANKLDTVHLELYGEVELPEELEGLIAATKEQRNMVTIDLTDEIDTESIIKEVAQRVSKEFATAMRYR